MSMCGHGDRKYRESRALLSSIGRNWSGIAADLRSHPACETPKFSPIYTEVTITIRGCSGLVVRNGAGERQETYSEPGKIWLTPAGVKDEISVVGVHEQVLHLFLPQQTFKSLASDERFRPDLYSLRYLADLQDDMI